MQEWADFCEHGDQQQADNVVVIGALPAYSYVSFDHPLKYRTAVRTGRRSFCVLPLKFMGF